MEQYAYYDAVTHSAEVALPGCADAVLAAFRELEATRVRKLGVEA